MGERFSKAFFTSFNKNRAQRQAFTIVELLIVVVVIAILATITTVAFTGITDQAKQSAAQSALSQGVKTVEIAVTRAGTGVYPVDKAAAGLTDTADVVYQYTPTATNDSYCLTALYKGEVSYNQQPSQPLMYGPCDGHNGGTGYCPVDTYVPINGFYCDGTVGQTPTLSSGVTKLLATDSEVVTYAPNAPGAFVGKQTTRDAYAGNAFAVVAGEVYCVSAWAASSTSTVGHTIGFQFTGSGMSNTWHNVGYVSTDGQWHKISGCRTVPAGYTSARMWTQNNGSNGSTADLPWYQTALRLWKQ